MAWPNDMPPDLQKSIRDLGKLKYVEANALLGCGVAVDFDIGVAPHLRPGSDMVGQNRWPTLAKPRLGRACGQLPQLSGVCVSTGDLPDIFDDFDAIAWPHT